MQTPSTCSRSPGSSFPGLQKAERGPRNKATHSLDLTSLDLVNNCMGTRLRSYAGLMRLVSYFMRSVIYFMRSVIYFMRSVIYFMRSVIYFMKLVSKYLLTAIRGGRLGTRVDLQLESI